MRLTRLIPTMFHRRLLLLGALVALAVTALAVQLGVLTVARGDELRAAAEARLRGVQWLPTIRGRILDRNGRVLAQDRPSFDLAVAYPVISGLWAEERAGRAARRLHRSTWRDLDGDERSLLVERYAAVYHAHLDSAWQTLADATGVGREALDASRLAVLNRVETLADVVTDARIRVRVDTALKRGEEITTELEDEIVGGARTEISEAESAHVILPHIADTVGFEITRLAARTIDLVLADGRVLEAGVPLLPGVEVVNAADREYPHDTITVRIDRSAFPGPLADDRPMDVTVDGVGIHVLGWTGRNASGDDVRARGELLRADRALREYATLALDGSEFDRGSYEPGDAVGRFGVEAAQEVRLRGLRGLNLRRLDTGEERRVDPEPGRDVTLTLDAMLQARVQALLTPSVGLAAVQEWHALPTQHPNGRPIGGTALGTPLHGAAVVLDIESGDILAMVSAPGFTRGDLRERSGALFTDPLRPWINRVVSASYPPGSIVKAPLLAAAVTLGKHALDRPIECNGHLLPHDPNTLRCWIYKRSQTDATPNTHTQMLGHALDAREALMVSCNIYFFTLGRQLGVDGVRSAYGMFGVGQTWNLGLARPGRPDDEYAGEIGRRVQEPDGTRRIAPLVIGDAIQMGIGQGPIAWTPLHAADALATLARGGVRVAPRLLADRPVTRQNLGLDPAAVAAALDGLSLSVSDPRGTGNHITISAGVQERIFNAPGVRVWGKTGTADAPKLAHDPDGLGPASAEELRDGDHSWFVVLVGREGGGPKYAIAVMMEYAGSGGKVSGPICNQIIHALIAGGYL